jgi:dCMP deaminase
MDCKRPNWDEYFMGLAIMASTRASCRHVRAGSVIVLDKRVVGTGYNGVPPGVKKNCIEGGCYKEKVGEKYGQSFGSGKCLGVHAEMNALANLSREIYQGATLYTTIFPCPGCAKNLIAHNIKRVVYKRGYDASETALSQRLFDEAGVKVEMLDMNPEQFSNLVFNQHDVLFDVFAKEEKEVSKH